MKFLLSLFLTFLKIGVTTFGGGYAMIANFHETIVEKKKWLDEEEFLEIITVAESTPGPIAINVATYVGFKKKGFLGSLFATLGVALPSIVIIFAISFVLDMFMSNVWVQYAFNGIKVAVAFLIVRAGYNMIKKLEKKIIPIISFSVVLVLVIVFEICSISFSSIFYILAGGLVGIFAYAVIKRPKSKKGGDK